ncbi:MAG: MT-A70 family methyltransferase [Hyphomicrobiaceae bacterium]
MTQKKHPKILVKREREAADRKAQHALVKHASPQWLSRLEVATMALAEIRDPASAKHAMDMASAMETFAKAQKLGDESERYARGIKYAAEIKLGEILKATPDAPSGRAAVAAKVSGTAKEPQTDWPPTLAELGISKKLSSESQRLAELPDEKKQALARGEIKPSVALRELKREGLAAKVAQLPEGKFRVIYADPPWSYGDERGGLEKADTAAAGQYPTMPVEAICALAPYDRPITDIFAKDAVLFMWATFPLLTEGLMVIKAWGFDYKTAFVWDKERSNIGNYHDARAELLMIGVRGSCPIEIDTRPKQVQSIARGRHSAKPEVFRELIDTLYPTGPRIELFRRGDVPKNWKTWGNEAADEQKESA